MMFLKKQLLTERGHPEVRCPRRRDARERHESPGLHPGWLSAAFRPHGWHRGPKAQCTSGP